VNVVLIGYRGAGKTTVGRFLSRRLKRPFVDCDEYIEESSSLSIREIFELCGERHFRVIESEAIERISARNGQVIATGGGAVLQYKNVRRLKANGVLFFLDADADVSHERICAEPGGLSRRPALTGKDRLVEVREQIAFRRPYYLRAADATIDTAGREPRAIADQIVAYLVERFGSLEEM
jgi:shikimate kinase